MRLYKAVITDIPDEAKINFYEMNSELRRDEDTPEEWGFPTWDDAGVMVQDPDWKPEGWIEFLQERSAGGQTWATDLLRDDAHFVWPNISKEYRSIGTARNKARVAEKWGATVTIMVAEVSPFEPVEDVRARRKAERDQVRIAKLEAKIRQIKDAA